MATPVRLAPRAPFRAANNDRYKVAMTQDVRVSASNCSTANLAAAGVFTGGRDSTLGVAGLQVNIKSDQNCTVCVQQSNDGTNWDFCDTFTYYHYYGGESRTVQATASYWRVVVTNIGTAATTYFRLQSVLCPVVEALPRSLTDSGSLKVSVEEMLDNTFGQSCSGSPMGVLRTVDSVRLVGATFVGDTLDTSFWRTTVVASGAVTQTGGEATLTTGETANGSVILNSQRRGRYVGANSNYYPWGGALPGGDRLEHPAVGCVRCQRRLLL